MPKQDYYVNPVHSFVGRDPDSGVPVYEDPDGNYIYFDDQDLPTPYRGFVETKHTFPDGTTIKGQFHVGVPEKCMCEFEEIWANGCQCGGFSSEKDSKAF